MTDSWWLSLDPDLNATLSRLPEIETELFQDLRKASDPEFYASGSTLGDLHWIVGSVAGLLAQGSALDLVRSKALQERLTIEGDAPNWSEVLLERRAEAREAALRDYENTVYPKLKMSIPPPMLGNFTWDLGLYDLCMFMTLGADSVWPDLHLTERVEPTFNNFRVRYADWLPKALRQGGWINERGELDWPLTRLEIESETVPWLPQSFWWRHLSDLVG